MKISFHHPDSIVGKANREAEEQREKNKKEQAKKYYHADMHPQSLGAASKATRDPKAVKHTKEHELSYWDKK